MKEGLACMHTQTLIQQTRRHERWWQQTAAVGVHEYDCDGGEERELLPLLLPKCLCLAISLSDCSSLSLARQPRTKLDIRTFPAFFKG